MSHAPEPVDVDVGALSAGDVFVWDLWDDYLVKHGGGGSCPRGIKEIIVENGSDATLTEVYLQRRIRPGATPTVNMRGARQFRLLADEAVADGEVRVVVIPEGC